MTDATEWMTPKQPWTGKIYCPGCGEEIPAVATAYGVRIVCEPEGRRWTRIRGEWGWVEETHSAMADNVKERDYGQG